MTGALLILAWFWPLALAALAWRQPFWWTPAAGALPALGASLLVPIGSTLDIPWLLLGSKLGLDDTGRAFLLFTSILWSAAGIYAAGRFRRGQEAARFRVFFLLAMAGNVWLIVAQDLVSFYTGFALMGLSSYGLVIHYGDPAALRAGRVYLAMTLVAEVALFMALVLIARHAGLSPSPQDLLGLSNWAIGLALFGLAVKAGLAPLHVWLPLAHPAAPVPASAVLSGTMIKVGLLGWLRFLPLGQAAFPEWGALVVAVGVATLLLALPVGMTQSDPKVILAYSSVSKMGLIAVGLGLILLEPRLAPLGVGALILYAGHHALVKGGLFLGVGLRKETRAGYWVLAGLAFLALALAGAPFTSGALAKYAIKPLLGGAEWSWLPAAVMLSTVGTTVLMARFLWVVWRVEIHPKPGLHAARIAWGILIALVVLIPFTPGQPASWPTNAIPVTVGVALAGGFALVAWFKPVSVSPLVGAVPPGDLVELGRPASAAVRAIAAAWRKFWAGTQARLPLQAPVIAALAARPARDPEGALRRWPTAGLLWLTIAASLLLALSQPYERLRIRTSPVAGFDRAAPESPARAPSLTHRDSATGPAPVSEAADIPIADAAAHRKGLQSPGRARSAASENSVAAREDRAPSGEKTEPSAATAGDASAAREVEVQRAPGADAVASGTARSGETDAGQTQIATAQPLRVCEPAPYVFRYAGEALKLTRCELDSKGAARLRSAPVVSNRLVTLLQRSLQDLGFDPGKVDGLIGPRTRAAVRRLQESEGTRATGRITFDLLDRVQQRLTAPTATDEPR